MLRKTLPGLSVGGTWIVPIREEITVTEFSFILEMPLEVAMEIAEVNERQALVNIRDANRRMGELARAGLTDYKESALFASVIQGLTHIDDSGAVWNAVAGDPRGKGPREMRTTSPENAVPLDLDKWRKRREDTRKKDAYKAKAKRIS